MVEAVQGKEDAMLNAITWPCASRLLVITFAFLVGALLAAPAMSTNAQGDDDDLDVPFFRADPNRTGIMPGPLPDTVPTEAWRASIGDNPFFFAAPVVAGGVVVYGGSANVLAFDAETGEAQWQFPVGGLSSSPAITDGLVIIGNETGDLVALDLETGTEQWRFADPQGAQMGSSPVVVDGMVYLGALMQDASLPGSGVNAVNAATGALVWSAATTGQVLGSPAVSGGLVVVGDLAGNMYAFDAASGALVWETFLVANGRLQSSPAIVNDTVYIGCCANQLQIGYLMTFDLNTGVEGWAYQTNADVVGSPAVDADTVYVGSADGNFYALAADGSSIRWVFETGGGIASSAALVDGAVVFTSGNGQLYALDSESGAEVWAYDVGAPTGASPVVSNGMIYLVVEGQLLALGSASGIRGETAEPTVVTDAAAADPTVVEPLPPGDTPATGADAASCDAASLAPEDQEYRESKLAELEELEASLDRALAGIYEQQSLDALREEQGAWKEQRIVNAVADATGAVPGGCTEFHELYVETLEVIVDAADTFLLGQATDDENAGVEALNRLEQAKAMAGLLREMLQ